MLDLRYRTAPLSALLAVALLAAAPARTAAAAPEVVATVKPVHSLVATVMGDVGEPALLVDGAATPHSYALKPSQARALERADLVIWVGPQLETFLIDPIESLAGGATHLTLAESPGMTLLPIRDGGVWEAHAHDHGHDHGHGDGDKHAHSDEHGHAKDEHAAHDHGAHDHGTHDHGAHDHGVHAGGDPIDGHLWLDPANARAIVAAVAESLAGLDPANAATYRDNAARADDRLRQLDSELQTELAPVRDVPFLVFHDAYQYLDSHFGLRAVGAVTVNPEVAPGASRLREIQERIIRQKAACVFAEPQFEPRVVQIAIEGTDVRTSVLDPLGADIANGPELYETLMRRNAEALRACLSGTS